MQCTSTVSLDALHFHTHEARSCLPNIVAIVDVCCLAGGAIPQNALRRHAQSRRRQPAGYEHQQSACPFQARCRRGGGWQRLRRCRVAGAQEAAPSIQRGCGPFWRRHRRGGRGGRAAGHAGSGGANSGCIWRRGRGAGRARCRRYPSPDHVTACCRLHPEVQILYCYVSEIWKVNWWAWRRRICVTYALHYYVVVFHCHFFSTFCLQQRMHIFSQS